MNLPRCHFLYMVEYLLMKFSTVGMTLKHTNILLCRLRKSMCSVQWASPVINDAIDNGRDWRGSALVSDGVQWVCVVWWSYLKLSQINKTDSAARFIYMSTKYHIISYHIISPIVQYDHFNTYVLHLSSYSAGASIVVEMKPFWNRSKLRKITVRQAYCPSGRVPRKAQAAFHRMHSQLPYQFVLRTFSNG